jgi:hypothetical protein
VVIDISREVFIPLGQAGADSVADRHFQRNGAMISRTTYATKEVPVRLSALGNAVRVEKGIPEPTLPADLVVNFSLVTLALRSHDGALFRGQSRNDEAGTQSPVLTPVRCRLATATASGLRRG